MAFDVRVGVPNSATGIQRQQVSMAAKIRRKSGAECLNWWGDNGRRGAMRRSGANPLEIGPELRCTLRQEGFRHLLARVPPQPDRRTWSTRHITLGQRLGRG